MKKIISQQPFKNFLQVFSATSGRLEYKFWWTFIKEYQSFLGSNMPALSIATIAFICGFISVILSFHSNLSYEILRELMFHSFYLVMLIVPVFLGLSSFVNEKKQGTMELIYTLPISELSVVIGKFLLGLFFGTFIAVSVAFVYLFFIAQVPWYIAISGVFGLILVASYSYSVILFASSLTNSYMAALLIASAILFVFDIGGFLAGLLPPLAKSIFSHFHGYYQFLPFTKGIISFRAVVFFVSLSVFFLFCTVKVLESRKWRT